MNKTEYIIKQIGKSYYKKYENYVITRIWHLLNNPNIKFVTQQHVSRPNGRALTDMFFPQIQLHIEVDELHHFNNDGSQIEQDISREADIINATNHTIKRVNIYAKDTDTSKPFPTINSIENINEQIDEIVDFIKNEVSSKIKNNSFVFWDIEAEFNPKTYIDRGVISVEDNVAFKTIADACNCFGHSYKGYQKAFARHLLEDKMLWFPKLYENAEWINEISTDESVIFEMRKYEHGSYFNKVKVLPDNLKERITFARVKSNLGDVMYRFKGVYKLDVSASEKFGKAIYNKTSETVKTYRPLNANN